MKMKYFDLPKYYFSLELNFSVHFVELKQKKIIFYLHQHLNVLSKHFMLCAPFTQEGHFAMLQVLLST